MLMGAMGQESGSAARIKDSEAPRVREVALFRDRKTGN